VNLEQGVIYRKARAETETDKRRPPVGISRRLAAHLSRWRPKNRKGHVIEADGAAVKSVRRAFHTARVAAGLGDDVVIHTLRHTFASHAIMNGVSFGEVAEAIGSTEGIVKRVYGHLAQGYTRATVEAVARGRR
jgi:integrase